MRRIYQRFSSSAAALSQKKSALNELNLFPKIVIPKVVSSQTAVAIHSVQELFSLSFAYLSSGDLKKAEQVFNKTIRTDIGIVKCRRQI